MAAAAAKPAPAMPGVNVPAVKVDTVGYPLAWKKIAIFNVEPKDARVVDDKGSVAYTFQPSDLIAKGKDAASLDQVWQADFSNLKKPGRYARLSLGVTEQRPRALERATTRTWSW